MSFLSGVLGGIVVLLRFAWRGAIGLLKLIPFLLELIDKAHKWASENIYARTMLLVASLLFGSFSLYDGWPILGHGLPIVTPAHQGDSPDGDFAQIQFDFAFNDVSSVIDCNVREDRKIMRRHIGPFADHEDKVLEPPQDFRRAVDGMTDALKPPALKSRKLVGLVLIGAADNRPLKGEALARYKTNQNLARERALSVKSEIERHMSTKVPQTMIAVLRAAEIEASGHTAQEMQSDRAVEICAVWGG
jgi:hypothetical protein